MEKMEKRGERGKKAIKGKRKIRRVTSTTDLKTGRTIRSIPSTGRMETIQESPVDQSLKRLKKRYSSVKSRLYQPTKSYLQKVRQPKKKRPVWR